MNCSDWEERIALYGGGDLPAAEAPGVERHVAECPGCQVLLSGIRESLGTLREAHQEPIAEAHFVAFRARVLSEIQGAQRRWWRSAWTYGLTVAAVLLVLLPLALRTRKEMPGPIHARVKSVAPPPVPAAIEKGVPEQTPAPRRARRIVPKPPVVDTAVKVQNAAEPLVVKLITNDPEVVIYWIADTKGE